MSLPVNLIRQFLASLPPSRVDRSIELTFKEVRSLLYFFDMTIDLIEVQTSAADICGDTALRDNLIKVRIGALEIIQILLSRITEEVTKDETEEGAWELN